MSPCRCAAPTAWRRPYRSLPPFPPIDLTCRPHRRRGFRQAPHGAAAHLPSRHRSADRRRHVQLQKALRRCARQVRQAPRQGREEQREASGPAGHASTTPPRITCSHDAEPAAVRRRGRGQLHRLRGGRAAERIASPASAGAPPLWRCMVAAPCIGHFCCCSRSCATSGTPSCAAQPALRPVLQRAVRVRGCELSAATPNRRHQDRWRILRARPGGDGYRLSFSCATLCDVPLAMPSVELSLLDTQERPWCARADAADFGAPLSLPPRGERAASLPLPSAARRRRPAARGRLSAGGALSLIRDSSLFQSSTNGHHPWQQ